MKLIMEKCPTDMCHASTLLKIGPDRFLAAWFGGTKEGNGDVAIWFTRGNEEHFEEPKILAQSEKAHWNPVLFRVDEKKIIIFYKVGNEISKWRTMYRVSEDNGETFGEEKELVPGDQGRRETGEKQTDPSEKWKNSGTGIYRTGNLESICGSFR